MGFSRWCVMSSKHSCPCFEGRKFCKQAFHSLTHVLIPWGHRGLMVMALDCGAGGCEFKPRRFQNIFDLMERFDGGDEKRFDGTV